jgi:hypothetical protein
LQTGFSGGGQLAEKVREFLELAEVQFVSLLGLYVVGLHLLRYFLPESPLALGRVQILESRQVQISPGFGRVMTLAAFLSHQRADVLRVILRPFRPPGDCAGQQGGDDQSG